MIIKVYATCLSLKPKCAKLCVVWSFPPTNGDCPLASLFITTTVVSTIGNIKASATSNICFETETPTVLSTSFQKYLIPQKLTP